MIRIFKRLPGVIFMVLLLGLAGKEALSHQRTYSPVEKRELQTRPEISITKVLDGRFQKKYESYLRDQFPGRDHWVSFQTDMELFMGKNEIHNVYIGKNHYLLEHYTEKEFDPQQISKNLQALEKFVGKTKQNADVHVMMVPTKSWVLREKLPAFAPHYKEQKFYDALQQKLEKEDVLISVEPVLDAHKEEEIYYRTDHHWTTLGAWYAYEQYTKAVGGDLQRAQGKKKFRCISKDFYGTTYAKINYARQADKIEIYESADKLRVVYNMGEKKTKTLYDFSFLKTADQYSVFTGGNQAVLEITGGIKNGKTLLLIKDSFANSILPFLAEDYEKLVVVDLRQLNVSGDRLLEMFSPTDILILYNSAQFAQDKEFEIKCN
ncbi:MAG: DHHW family protein [Roseburia faecis]